MDTKLSTSRKLKRMLANILSIVVILAMAFPVTGSVYAQDPEHKVGLVTYLGGVEDNSFNWMAYQGLLQAQTELGISPTVYVPEDESQFDTLLNQCADEGNELCIAVGFNYGVGLANAARVYADTKWGIVDYSYPDCWEGATAGVDCGSFDELSNVRGLRFNEKQAGYLAGVLAGGMTTNNVVGVVGGIDVPPVVAFVEGYRNGAQCTNPAVSVLSTYTGTFVDPDLGASTAQDMIGQGADVIFGAAGPTGDGAILYSAQNGQWAIGVDTDQYFTVFGNGTVTGSDKILSSAMKRVDNAVYQTIKDYVNGDFSSGTVLYDLAMDGVGLAQFHETDSSIPQEVKDKLEIVKQGIIAGTINIDDSCAPPPPLQGEHLGSEGVGHPNSCNAYGWAIDPNDPTREVSIRVQGNGEILANGATEGHGFYFNLYGLIENYQEYQITAQAYDEETESWLDLDGTPKSIICTNYDLYIFDTKTGKAERLTINLPPNTGEYNPSWSPDGQKIVHDVASVDLNTLYITDVNTHVSAPLPGADGGNDAVWSPNGKWIVFDRRWNDDPNLYILPPAGGTPKLVASNAVNGNWSPDSQRLVFERDGGLWTANVKGGDENQIVAAGYNPAWSPNGMWIAYDLDGDIYKVRVNKNSAPIGDPIQLTSGPASDGGATWSQDSKQVAFASDISGDHDIWQISAEGGSPVRLVRTNIYGDYDPSYNNTGQYIAYDGAKEPAQPYIVAFPEWGYIEGQDWPMNDMVHLTIDDPTTDIKPDYEAEQPTVANDWGTWWVQFNFDYDLKIGDRVTETDGYLIRTYTVRNLTVTDANLLADFVTGSADPGAVVYVWAWGRDDSNLELLTAQDGTWIADYSTMEFDLGAGMCGRAEVRDKIGNRTAVDWCVPNPRIVASEAGDWFWMTEFNVGTLYLSLYESADEDSPLLWSGNAEVTDTWGITFVGYDMHGQDMMPGNYLVVSDGVNSKGIVLETITVDVFDVENEIMAGTAPLGRDVWAAAGPQEWQERIMVTADSETGAWLADFKTIGFDITEDMRGWSSAAIYDEDGDANEGSTPPPPPNPHFGVRANVDQVEGWEWNVGDTVTLAVDDPDTGEGTDFTIDGKVEVASWDPNQSYVYFGLWNVFDIQPGYEVSLSNGSITKTTTVTNLAFTDIDLVLNLVTGTAAPDSRVDIWACDNITCINRHINADGAGIWTADFGNVGDEDDEQNTFDLVPGTWIDSSQTDDDNDQTYWGERVPNPYIEAAPYSDWIHAREWPLGTVMTLNIDDPADGIGNDDVDHNPIDYSETGIMQQAPWNPGDPNDILADFRWPDQFAPGPGYVLTMSGDNGQAKTLIISQLNITNFDIEADVISGVGTANTQIQVCANIPNRCITRWVTADGDGNWTADYGEPGTGNDDPDTVDVQPWGNGWAAETDADADRTWFDWRIPNPYFRVFPEWEYIDGGDWPQGVTVSASVSGKPLCIASDVAEHQGGDPWNTFINMGFPAGCNIEVGDFVTITDGNTTLTHTVLDLAVTELDKVNNLVAGTAGVGAVVHIWDGFGNELDVVSNGIWQVQFETDLTEGMCVRAEVHDTPGYLWSSGTAVNPCVPNPRIVASITEDWFYTQEFAPNTSLDVTIYENQGGAQIWTGIATTDGSGFVWVNAEGRWDLMPDSYLVVSDYNTTKELALEGFTFDSFNLTTGQLFGTAPAPYGRRVWVGIGWENTGWSTDVFTDGDGNWFADYGSPITNGFSWVAAQIFDGDGDATELRPGEIVGRTLTLGNFSLSWSLTNPEEVNYLSWKGSANLVSSCTPPDCQDDFEFFGNSWVSENENTPGFFFASLVGGGTTGSWAQTGTTVDIHSTCLGCWNSVDTPVHTSYQFFDDPSKANLIAITRTFEFGETLFTHAIRAFIPRLYPFSGFNQVVYQDVNGNLVITEAICDFGCQVTGWDGSWFAINNPSTGQGVILQRAPSTIATALWLDWDAASFTNASNFLLLPPEGGFTGTVTETEYLCFYDSSTWTPSLVLPEGCQP